MWSRGARTIITGLMSLALLAVQVPSAVVAEELCSLPSGTYAGAKTRHPELAFALTEIEKRGIAAWYTDRASPGDRLANVQRLVGSCHESTRLNLVVYGLPNKDCDAGYSSGGSVKSPQDYEQFIGALASTVGQRKALFVLEPDAVGLLASEGNACGRNAGYLPNLQNAIRILSANPNADIYVDVGHWTIGHPASAARVAAIVRELARAGRIKGITLNTSNYRSNDELARLCGNFQQAYGSSEMKCIVDTSRNFNGAPTDEWCNLRTAGIGTPPTSNTGIPNIDYFLWIKTPGESDGQCDKGHSNLAMVGPAAGQFFAESFRALWDQGFFVQREKMPRIGEYVAPPPPPVAPTTTAPLPPPTTPEPTTTTPAAEPVWAPEPRTSTATSNTSSTWDQEAWDRLVAEWEATSQPPATTTTPPPPPPTTPTTTPVPTKPIVKSVPVTSSPAPPSTTTERGVPEVRANTNKESSMGTTGTFAVVGVVGIVAVVVAIVLVVRIRRRRPTENKHPRGSLVSYMSMTRPSEA